MAATTTDAPRGTAALLLRISGTLYRLTPIAGGWTLRRPGGPAYALIGTPGGVACSCPAARYRAADGPCKHRRAAAAAGLPIA